MRFEGVFSILHLGIQIYQQYCLCNIMGDLLLNWLNDQIQLSRRVVNFEEDFHNGFLFGQLLAKYSQQLNFHEFIDKDDKAARVNNYSLLLDTFTALKVTFDANVAFKIINRQLGVAKKLLYELKTQLEKTNDNAFSKTAKPSKTLTPLKKLQISKEKFDQVQKEHFVKQLNELHPAQKEIIEQKLLKKFSDFHHTSLVKVGNEEEKEQQVRLLLRSKFHDQQRDNLKKSEEFRKQWEADNREKWANNMTIRHLQINKDSEFRQKEDQSKIKSKINSEASALKALEADIAAFQRKNLRSRKGKDSDSEQEEKPSQQAKSPAPAVVAEGRQERRVPNVENEKKKHQRQKRRRKMIVEQMKKYQLIEINRRERIIIATIEQTSKQEKELQYEIWRAWQNKHVIMDNKRLETDKIAEKDETRSINAKFKKDELIKTFREEHHREVEEAMNKITQLQRVQQARERKQTYSSCQGIIEELLTITEKMYLSAQQRNEPNLSDQELQAQLVKFITGTKDEDENILNIKHYIEGTHEWNIPIVRPEEQVSINPQQDNSLPNQTVNNYYLGNILKKVFQKVHEERNEEVKVQPQRVVVALMGLQFSRKHQAAMAIAQKYQFTVIEVEKLIENKLKDWIDLEKKGIEVSQETQEIAIQCLSGRPIEEKTIVKLVKEAIETNSRSIILDYPSTYEQAIQLCNLVGGVQPNDLTEKDPLIKKIEEFSRLVKPNDPKIVPRQIKGCGIDFIFWINTTPQNSFDRMLGRRWIENKVVSVYDDVDPDLLKEGEKASAVAMKNHFKLMNKGKLQDWFSLFGFQAPDSQSIYHSWHELEGNDNAENLMTQMLAKIEQALNIKEKEKEGLKQEEEKRKKETQEQEKLEKLREEIKQKCLRSNPQTLKEELGSALSKVDLPKNFVEQLAQVWNKTQNFTLGSFKKVFQSLSQQQKSKRAYVANLKRNFIGLLTREDHKFHLIKNFQKTYNEFLAVNQDMLAFEYTKEELHQRVQDLENDLLTLVEEKKDDALAERASAMSSGWLEAQIDLIYEAILLLVQAQLNRFSVSEKIIVDFYGKKFGCNTKSFEPLTPQINTETFTSIEAFKDGQCPRLDKVISEALRILNRQQEVVDDKNKKGGKGAPAKKEQKKPVKKGGKEQVQQIKQPTPEQIEMKSAVNTEKAILRQRLNRIKTLASKIIKENYSDANKLYSSLEDLYLYTFKVEQKAIFGLSKIFKKSIENEEKIEFQIQIKHVEVVQTQSIRNFEKPKPIIQPAREDLSQNQFTLTNLMEVFKLIRGEAQGARISTKRLTVLLNRLITCDFYKKMIPKTWKSLTTSNLESFVKLLDRSNKAYVNLAEVFLFFVMTGFIIPTQAQMQQYSLQLSNYSSLKEAEEEKIVQTNSWFDLELIEYANMRIFDRNKQTKRVLFNIFKNENEVVHVQSFLSAINLIQVEKAKNLKRGQQTYFEAAFF